MSRLLETIRIQHCQAQNLAYHQTRLNRSQAAHFQGFKAIDLAKEIKRLSMSLNLDLVYKCRVLYRQQIEKIEFHPYQAKPIQTLQCVINDDISYDHKYEKRVDLNHLFSQKKEADDVLIIKNGLVTDTSYATILFWDKKNWFVPLSSLLKGTQRQFLLDQQQITATNIPYQNIWNYSHFKLVNAMLPFEEAPILSTLQIQQSIGQID